MKKSSKLHVMVLGLSMLHAPALLADNAATAFTRDGTAVIGAAASTTSGADGYAKVLSTTLSNSGAPKDLVIGLSFETSLWTETVVRSKGGDKSSAEADAKIEMKVYVDGALAEPGEVVFDRRRQELWAELGGVLNCSDLNGDGIVSFDECDLSEEEIGLILETTAAHSFNFLAFNIGSGSHVIEAYARLSRDGSVQSCTSCEASSWDASASLGKGTLAVWEMHDAVTK